MVDETNPIVIGVDVSPVEGRDDSVVLSLAIGQVLPIPDQHGNPIPMQTGIKRFVLPRQTALDIAKLLTDTAEPLRNPSNIPVASNMGEVEAAAQRLQDMQNGR